MWKKKNISWHMKFKFYVHKIFIGTQSCSFIYMLSMVAFMLQRQSWIAVIETIYGLQISSIYYLVLRRKCFLSPAVNKNPLYQDQEQAGLMAAEHWARLLSARHRNAIAQAQSRTAVRRWSCALYTVRREQKSNQEWECTPTPT